MGRTRFDPSLAGRTKSIAVYDLGGKLMWQSMVRKNHVDLQKVFGQAGGVYIIKVKTAR